MTDPEPPKKKSWGSLQWGVVIAVGLLMSAFGITTYREIKEMADTTVACHNIYELMNTMRLYANDNNDVYPDTKHPEAASSNQVFRVIFQEEITKQERLFGARVSKFVPDGNIGKAPQYSEAVTAGENHWALVAGQNVKSLGHYPLVFENAVDATWPPKWLPDTAGRFIRGRTWRGNKIIVGRVDSGTAMENLEAAGEFVTLPPHVLRSDGNEAGVTFKVLDVEERTR